MVFGAVPSRDLPTTRSNFQVNAHLPKRLGQVARHPVVEPPYVPELNPVKRFFRELCRADGSIQQAKQEVLEPILKMWHAAWVRPLCGWDWIRDDLEALRADTQVIQP